MDDISFQLTLYEFKHGSLSSDVNRFESLFIDQAEIPNSHSNYTDRDIQIQFHTTISNYMVEGSFNNEVISLGSNMVFSLIHYTPSVCSFSNVLLF